jgi:hypothetical protein
MLVVAVFCNAPTGVVKLPLEKNADITAVHNGVTHFS